MEKHKLPFEEIKENEGFMRSVIDASPNLIFVKDVEGKYILANKAVADLYGTTVEEMEGKTDFYFAGKEVVSPEEVKEYLKADKDVIISKKVKYISEESVTDKNTGNIRYFQTTKIPLIIRNRPKYILGICFDITERKKTEQEFEELTEDLKRSNEELEQYAYIASHDLQAPLRVIKSYCQLIERFYKENCKKHLEGECYEEMEKYVGFVINSVEKMRRLIRDLLEYSKAGSPLVPYEEIDIKKLLDNVLLDFEIKKNNFQININGILNVFAIKKQLNRIFHNLISNAIKFKDPHRDVIIDIGAEARENDYLFYITDNGIGIDKDQFRKIFYLFKRLHTDEEYEGTGLGLAFVKKLVNNHDGEIWVESEIGKGSTFYFTIPYI